MQRNTGELEALLPNILDAPSDHGVIDLIVRRPDQDEREVVDFASLNEADGLVGDNWKQRVDENGNPHFHAQLTLMNSRVADAVAASQERWPLAGDQIYVDMDLSMENLPAGSRIRVGEAIVEISDVPHTGCHKFASRFGKEALRFANVGVGKEKRFRGVNAFVIEAGDVALGDTVSKL